jgi:DNA-binding MarR family transcriptional regulator
VSKDAAKGAKKARVRRNSLTAAEAAVVKALIAGEKHSNQEIAGLINRARGDATRAFDR